MADLLRLPEQLAAELLRRAGQAARSAYCPYSRFRVGAAVLSADGRVFTGCNVENASYGLTVCAERVAIAAAVAAGVRRLVAVAVVAPGSEPTPPCGACRQVIAEFASHDCVVHAAPQGRRLHRVSWRLADLLPATFRMATRRRKSR
jgi:cytidine deaminase